MSTLLVLTLGQTDVQIVLDGVRREMRKDRCAAPHDELEQRASKCRIVDAPDRKTEPPIEALPEGELLLCTPKLDAVLREVVPAFALLLETRRDARAAPGDPRFAGAVLEARLKASGVETIHRCAYLQGSERLEDRDQPRDAVIRREVVRRLEQAVRESLEAVTPSRVVVAATGGFPVVSDLVEEIVRLHASVPVELLEVADGAKANPPAADRAVTRTSIPEPAESYRARRHVLDLIDGGNLLGAWGAARHLHGDEVEVRWTRVVEWLSRFAASLPIPDECDITVLRHPKMAVRAALRVEFALRASDVPRAVHGTVALFEAALWDRLGERVERSTDPERRRHFKIKSGEAPSGDKLLRKGDGSDDDRKRPFEFKETESGIDWFWIYDDEACAGRLAKYYLKSTPLQNLGQAVSKIRELRNDVAHNEPTPDLMDDARSRMADVGLWSPEDRFLTQQLVRDVLVETGEKNPDELCDDLLSMLRSRLLDPPR